LRCEDHVEVDPCYFFRPSEVDLLQGDATKARERLGWRTETSFRELVTLMVESDWMQDREERILAAHRGG
jgi:GDPmannose 4,6-dehydratase